MYRYTNYFLAYIFFTTVYALSIFGNLSNSIYFFSFLLSTFFLVFKFEYLPNKYLSDPRVHFYAKQRLNEYGYLMIGLFIFSILLYSIASFYIGSTASIILIILWPLNTLIAIYFGNKFATRNPENATLDYIKRQSNIHTNEKVESIEKFIQASDKGEKNSETFLANLNTEEKILVIRLYAKYKFRNKDKLVSDEIRNLE